ncbi:SDR family NAD(P)-dependent oxidoreductase [Bacillus sp. MRMR6]|uniref:SDR family NAD(P)-dependent oxidoreductase n=1 Tax=Bacillus sp. MRMR6 TaxID=1928617 RepID=UPI000951C8DF|nr:SDR family NAD(P)-dependent oxidoreductase [Bacillus sp. MRMR6]OLS36186.1 short-chain dehydrogenase [Bacillus sp. MRMR6]
MRLKNKVAIITGSGSGQGKAAAKVFAKEGAIVVIAEWNEENGKRVEAEIKASGHEALFFQTDVSNENHIISLVDEVINRYGRIDVVFNNAGVGFSSSSKYKMDRLTETPLHDWNQILAINLNGVYLLSKYVIPIMKKQNAGSIINNSSLNGIIGVPGADAYTAAKGGVVALTRVMAVDYGKFNIRVNCICPGAIDTPMIADVLKNEAFAAAFTSNPLRRVGTPEEIANAALFLASDESSYVTGLIMPVDGGISAQ